MATETTHMIKRSNVEVGIIGMGEMGRLYAAYISSAGWRVNACDKQELYAKLLDEFSGSCINVLENGHLVSRRSDYIIYSVEAENIDKIVQTYGPSTKVGAIVGGQTSCKTPEIRAFEKYLPQDVDIVSCHSLHGPSVDPRGESLVMIRHRASDKNFELAREILSCLGSEMVFLSAQEHDRITADTQAATHAAFLSMGAAWQANGEFPWQVSRYAGGIENVKINITMRIYSNKWHVYAGLAIMNPSAREQIKQYATSVTELFKLMTEGKSQEFGERIRTAGRAVFGNSTQSMLLRDEVLDKFSLGRVPPEEKLPNSHLSLLAMVDCWWKMGIIPFNHIICSTPLFRLWLGTTEYLFRQPQLLEECIVVAMKDTKFRSDDLEFTFAARGWSECVAFADFESFRKRFEVIQHYFAPRFPEAIEVGNEMIRTIFAKTHSRDV